MPELAPHQREAVAAIRRLLDRYGGAILADEVGLGKSYVAAAIAAEMRPVEVLVPAALTGQWRDTLGEFGVEARILTHDSLIGDRFALNGERRFLVVDEAHAFRNPRTQRYAALARRSVAARLLLVTATPVCNSAADLHALVALIAADDALRHCGVTSITDAFAARDSTSIGAIVAELVIRRARDVLPDALRFGELERRVIRHPVPDAPIDELQFPLTGSAALLRQFVWRRLESSHAALLESIRRQLRFYERVVESGRGLTRRDYRRAFATEEDGEAFQQILFWNLWTPSASADLGAVREEMQRLAALRAFVEGCPDAKRALLADALTGEPALIFTGAAATARDLARHLRCGLATSRDGTAAIDAFRRGAIDLLVATDLAAEGLNLQRAGVVVHYDIPWNPVKLDQRNGRAHRIGQRRPLVRAIYFLPDRDPARVLSIVASKNRTRRRILRSQPAPPVDLTALPTRLRGDAPEAALLRALRARNLPPPPTLLHPHRAGAAQLIAEMSGEYLDEARVAELAEVLEREQEITRA
jgi:Helicase conserved C-terminal domain/SNF2-related domain